MKKKQTNQIIFYGLFLVILSVPLLMFLKNKLEVMNGPDTLRHYVSDDGVDGGYGNNATYKSKEVMSETVEETDNDSFSIIVLPDTQKYAKHYPEIFCEQTKWIVENENKLNVELALQLGDIVDSGSDSMAEWEVAKNCLMKLNGQIPWSVLPGNHDTDKQSNKTSGLSTYDRYFPASLFSDFKWYKEGYKNNQNSFIMIESEGMKVGLLNLSIEPEDDVLKWAALKIKENPKIYFIVATHKYLRDDGKGRDVGLDFGPVGNDGEQIWQKLVKKNCEIGLVLNGHFNKADGEDRIVSKNNCGDDVVQVTQDYQSRESGGNGRLRIYTFTPEKNEVKVRTYSPHTKSFEVDEDSQFEFEI